jgi:hypothetical protein
MRTVYRRGRVGACLFLGLGGSFVASAGHAIAGIGLRWEFAFFCLLGACSIGAGVCILLNRVAVDDRGLDRRAPFEGSFRASWDEVESWWVQRESTGDETFPQARFRLCGQRDSAVVSAADVARPGFDTFLQDVRARIPGRETADPTPARDGAGG